MHWENSETPTNTSCVKQLIEVFVPAKKTRILSHRQLQKKKRLNLSIISCRQLKPNRKLTLSSTYLKANLPDDLSKPAETQPNSHVRVKIQQNMHLNSFDMKKSHDIVDPTICKKVMFRSFDAGRSDSPQRNLKTYRNQRTTNTRLKTNHRLQEKKPPKFSITSPSSFMQSQINACYDKEQNTSPSEPQQKVAPVHQDSEQVVSPQRQSQFYVLDPEQLSSESDIRQREKLLQILQENSNMKSKQSFQTVKKTVVDESPWKMIERLDQIGGTIVSKFDESSKKSESLAASNVIYRLDGNVTKLIDRNSEDQRWHSPVFPIEWEERNHNSIQAASANKWESFGEMPGEEYDQAIYESFEEDAEGQKSTSFEKINYLGVGRFASVYQVKDAKSGMIFAIKEILKFTVECNSLDGQLMKQIQIQSKVKHPNIIALYFAFANTKKYHLVLEYGQTNLMKIVRENGPLPEQRCIECLRQISEGLQALHQNGVVHRDIKLQNIILVNGVCKIGDFGWADWISSEGLAEVCGTPCYASPQIMRSKNYTNKTDCWSLGILAYELIAGLLPEECFSDQILRVDRLKFNGAKVSEKYRDLVKKLLEEEQKDRPNIEEILGHQLFFGS